MNRCRTETARSLIMSSPLRSENRRRWIWRQPSPYPSAAGLYHPAGWGTSLWSRDVNGTADPIECDCHSSWRENDQQHQQTPSPSFISVTLKQQLLSPELVNKAMSKFIFQLAYSMFSSPSYLGQLNNCIPRPITDCKAKRWRKQSGTIRAS